MRDWDQERNASIQIRSLATKWLGQSPRLQILVRFSKRVLAEKRDRD